MFICALNFLLLSKYNKLLSCCQIPSWICCNLEGNSQDASHDEYISSSVEMDVLDGTIEEIDGVRFCDGEPIANIPLLCVSIKFFSICTYLVTLHFKWTQALRMPQPL